MNSCIKSQSSATTFCKTLNCAYPSGVTANEKRGIRQQATLFEVRYGLLFYKAEDVCLKRVIAKENEKVRIACHDGVDGCHYIETNKTRSKVRDLARLYYLYLSLAL